LEEGKRGQANITQPGSNALKREAAGDELAASEKKNGTLGFENKSSEVRELLDSMERDPLLRHELLVYFYKYKNQQKQNIQEVEGIKD
jgi:hypothetical protein